MARGPVRDGFEKALKNARRQKIIYARHEGTIAAARALADKIDQWDVIVQWAVEDKEALGLQRPVVPQNDNTSLPTFLKYMDALGLTVAADRAETKVATAAAKAKGKQSVSKLEVLQKEVGVAVAS
ncbi:terminase small subunit [Candidatus Darwinibacter acetoxidans]